MMAQIEIQLTDEHGKVRPLRDLEREARHQIVKKAKHLCGSTRETAIDLGVHFHTVMRALGTWGGKK